MKTVSLEKHLVAVLLFFITVAVMPTLALGAGDEKRILITPFEITAEENLEFLKKGIEKMLEARLTEPGKSTVSFGSDPAVAPNADYIVTGSILVFGKQVSTDVKLLKGSDGSVALSFNQMGENKGDVIRHIDVFADNIRVKALGLPPAAGLAAPEVQQPPNYAQAPNAYRQGQMAGYQVPEEIWRGPFMETEILSVAVADLDNDGANETLVLTEDGLSIYRRNGDALAPVSENKLGERNVKPLYVDTIDLDQDGRPEVCITAIHEKRLKAASMVYNVENMRLTKRIDSLPYLLRVVKKGDVYVLIGQETRGEGDQMLRNPVVELGLGPNERDLVRSGDSYPFADNVYGIAFGDFLNNGEEDIAVLDLGGNISIYDPGGRVIYKGSEDYGGTKKFLEYKGMRYTKDDAYKLDRIFLQQRLFAADLDGDGKLNLITVQNSDTARGLLSSTKIYSKSYIDILVWNELGLATQNRSQALSGYVSDFTVADMDSDGKEEVVFSLVSSGKLLEDSRSQIFTKR